MSLNGSGGWANGVPSIEARELVKRFGTFVANDHVSLQAYAGKVLAGGRREWRRQVDSDEY